jgi:hypothetical protein
MLALLVLSARPVFLRLLPPERATPGGLATSRGKRRTKWPATLVLRADFPNGSLFSASGLPFGHNALSINHLEQFLYRHLVSGFSHLPRLVLLGGPTDHPSSRPLIANAAASFANRVINH